MTRVTGSAAAWCGLGMLAGRGGECKAESAMVWWVPDPEHGPGDLATIPLVTGNRSRLKECVFDRCPPPRHDASTRGRPAPGSPPCPPQAAAANPAQHAATAEPQRG